MEDKIKILYYALKIFSCNFLDHEKRGDLLPIKERLGQMREFTVWFLEADHLGVGEERYTKMQQELLAVLTDILDAIEGEDIVLLHDAVEFGFLKYLEYFVKKEDGEKSYDAV
jgi:hypothetical protein